MDDITGGSAGIIKNPSHITKLLVFGLFGLTINIFPPKKIVLKDRNFQKQNI